MIIDDHEFEIVARGDTAQALNGMGPGCRVTVEGRLRGHRWQTQGGVWHNHVEIQADKVERHGQAPVPV